MTDPFDNDDGDDSPEQIRDELREAFKDADLFAGVAINLDPDADDTVVTARSHSQRLIEENDHEMADVLHALLVLDEELNNLLLDEEFKMMLRMRQQAETGTISGGSGVLALTEEEAREAGLIDAIEKLTGESLTGAETDEEMDGGTSIDIE